MVKGIEARLYHISNSQHNEKARTLRSLQSYLRPFPVDESIGFLAVLFYLVEGFSCALPLSLAAPLALALATSFAAGPLTESLPEPWVRGSGARGRGPGPAARALGPKPRGRGPRA